MRAKQHANRPQTHSRFNVWVHFMLKCLGPFPLEFWFYLIGMLGFLVSCNEHECVPSHRSGIVRDKFSPWVGPDKTSVNILSATSSFCTLASLFPSICTKTKSLLGVLSKPVLLSIANAFHSSETVFSPEAVWLLNIKAVKQELIGAEKP